MSYDLDIEQVKSLLMHVQATQHATNHLLEKNIALNSGIDHNLLGYQTEKKEYRQLDELFEEYVQKDAGELQKAVEKLLKTQQSQLLLVAKILSSLQDKPYPDVLKEAIHQIGSFYIDHS